MHERPNFIQLVDDSRGGAIEVTEQVTLYLWSWPCQWWRQLKSKLSCICVKCLIILNVIDVNCDVSKESKSLLSPPLPALFHSLCELGDRDWDLIVETIFTARHVSRNTSAFSTCLSQIQYAFDNLRWKGNKFTSIAGKYVWSFCKKSTQHEHLLFNQCDWLNG